VSSIIDHHTTSKDLLDLLLKNRHIRNSEEFLKPSFPQLHLQLKPAVKLIKKAIANKKNILIYGDYDVDGITATAILWQAIYAVYPNIIPFIPHREIDGYGFKAKSFFRFQQEKKTNFDLLITVDNGIVADAEFAKIKAKQPIKIIVTDHHLTNSRLKSIDTLVHSIKVSGAAISWFLAHELNPNADLGLAALGTVADCLPLIDINRSIVVHGLQSLRLNPNPGIKKLIQISGLKPDSISVYDLGFVLGPRINAVGRLADPTDALRLLCSQNSFQAAKYAGSLNSYNQDRQLLQKESTELAEKIFCKSGSRIRSSLIFIYEPSFNPGIIGLIAGRLTEKYYLPSIILSSNDGVAKGSCRSIPGLNIIEFLRQFSDLFIDLGGHSAAAGFTIKVENIKKLQIKLTREINKKLKKIVLKPSLNTDAEMTISAANLKNYHTIQQLSPFGIGNSEPLFLFKNLTINFKKVIGSTGDHLKLKLDKIDAIAFKKGELAKTLNIGDNIDIIASLDINTWNNITTPQLIIKEIISVLK
jgi:single-stranded-DNA-specific exonuclease